MLAVLTGSGNARSRRRIPCASDAAAEYAPGAARCRDVKVRDIMDDNNGRCDLADVGDDVEVTRDHHAIEGASRVNHRGTVTRVDYGTLLPFRVRFSDGEQRWVRRVVWREPVEDVVVHRLVRVGRDAVRSYAAVKYQEAAPAGSGDAEASAGDFGVRLLMNLTDPALSDIAVAVVRAASSFASIDEMAGAAVDARMFAGALDARAIARMAGMDEEAMSRVLEAMKRELSRKWSP